MDIDTQYNMYYMWTHNFDYMSVYVYIDIDTHQKVKKKRAFA